MSPRTVVIVFSTVRHRSSFNRSRRLLALFAGGITLASLAGCAMWHGSAEIGPNLKPRLGTSISVPVGR